MAELLYVARHDQGPGELGEAGPKALLGMLSEKLVGILRQVWEKMVQAVGIVASFAGALAKGTATVLEVGKLVTEAGAGFALGLVQAVVVFPQQVGEAMRQADAQRDEALRVFREENEELAAKYDQMIYEMSTFKAAKDFASELSRVGAVQAGEFLSSLKHTFSSPENLKRSLVGTMNVLKAGREQMDLIRSAERIRQEALMAENHKDVFTDVSDILAFGEFYCGTTTEVAHDFLVQQKQAAGVRFDQTVGVGSPRHVSLRTFQDGERRTHRGIMLHKKGLWTVSFQVTCVAPHTPGTIIAPQNVDFYVEAEVFDAGGRKISSREFHATTVNHVGARGVVTVNASFAVPADSSGYQISVRTVGAGYVGGLAKSRIAAYMTDSDRITEIINQQGQTQQQKQQQQQVAERNVTTKAAQVTRDIQTWERNYG